MNKMKTNRLLDIVLGVLLLLVGVSTFGAGKRIAYAEYSVLETRSPLAFYKFHIIVGLFLTALLIAHVMLHWKWISAVAISPQKKLAKKLVIDRVIDTNLFITFLLCTISGLALFVIYKADITNLLFPLKGLLILHRLSGIGMLIISLVHILHHVKFKKPKKQLVRISLDRQTGNRATVLNN